MKKKCIAQLRHRVPNTRRSPVSAPARQPARERFRSTLGGFPSACILLGLLGLLGLLVFFTGILVALFAAADPQSFRRDADRGPATSSGTVQEAWVARYNGPTNGYDEGQAIAVDGSGNVYVTGSSAGDYVTIKYDTSGQEQWVARYTGGRARAIAVDSSANVYVTGESSLPGGFLDYATIKYNSAGQAQWVARYNGPASGNDSASSLVLDSSGNVYVMGESLGLGTGLDYATIKYNSAGLQQWVGRYNGPGNGDDYAAYARAIVLDGSGNVYVTGGSAGSGTYDDYATIKYNSAGHQQWVARYNGPRNGGDHANAIAIDPVGHICVTGFSTDPQTDVDCATIKYDSAGGRQEWAVRYNGSANDLDYGNAIAIDGLGNVCVAATSFSSGGNGDYAVIKYNSAGQEQWVARYDAGSTEYATAISVDALNNIYVTGTSSHTGLNNDYATVKYDLLGQEQWAARYNGHGTGYDRANAIAIDGSGNVYVTGNSYVSGSFSDCATIKYIQPTPGVTPRPRPSPAPRP